MLHDVDVDEGVVEELPGESEVVIASGGGSEVKLANVFSLEQSNGLLRSDILEFEVLNLPPDHHLFLETLLEVLGYLELVVDFVLLRHSDPLRHQLVEVLLVVLQVAVFAVQTH
jgi:hypothetical protein